MLVCKAARVGAKDFLKALPGLVDARTDRACCAVRGGLVVIGGDARRGGEARSRANLPCHAAG